MSCVVICIIYEINLLDISKIHSHFTMAISVLRRVEKSDEAFRKRIFTAQSFLYQSISDSNNLTFKG